MKRPYAFLALGFAAANLAYLLAYNILAEYAPLVYAAAWLLIGAVSSRRLGIIEGDVLARALGPWWLVHIAAFALIGVALNAVAASVKNMLYWLGYVAMLVAGREMLRGEVAHEKPWLSWLIGFASFYPLSVYANLVYAPFKLVRSVAWIAAIESVAAVMYSRGASPATVAVFEVCGYAPYVWLPVTLTGGPVVTAYVAMLATLASTYTLLPREERPSIASIAALTTTLTLVLLAFGQLGYALFIVGSGSMRPALEPGDLVIVKTSVDKLHIPEGSIIAYRSDGKVIIHRVVKVLAPGIYETKGDANNMLDPKPVTVDEVIGVVVAKVPKLGLLITEARSNKLLMAALLALPAVAAIVSGFRRNG